MVPKGTPLVFLIKFPTNWLAAITLETWVHLNFIDSKKLNSFNFSLNSLHLWKWPLWHLLESHAIRARGTRWKRTCMLRGNARIASFSNTKAEFWWHIFHKLCILRDHFFFLFFLFVKLIFTIRIQDTEYNVWIICTGVRQKKLYLQGFSFKPYQILWGTKKIYFHLDSVWFFRKGREQVDKVNYGGCSTLCLRTCLRGCESFGMSS
jgi:hypothetical protein